jgi:modulator of FtsH protease
MPIMSTLTPATIASTARVSPEAQRVLRNTYALLSLTLLFAAGTAGASMALGLPHPGILITLAGYFGLLFVIHKFRNSAAGVALVFALTGFMGMTLGPVVGQVLAGANGAMTVMLAAGLTGTMFLGLSGYALATQRDVSGWGAPLTVGVLVAFGAGLLSLFVDIPGLSLAVSAMFTVLMAGIIVYETSNIIQGGERNYVLATVSLFVAIYNLFASLMHLLGVGSGE